MASISSTATGEAANEPRYPARPEQLRVEPRPARPTIEPGRWGRRTPLFLAPVRSTCGLVLHHEHPPRIALITTRLPGRRAGSRSHGSIAPPSRSNESHGHGFPRGTRKWFGQKRTARHLTALKYKEGAARPHNFNGVPATSGANTQQEAVRSAPQRVPLGPPATAACRLDPETRRTVILDHKKRSGSSRRRSRHKFGHHPVME